MAHLPEWFWLRVSQEVADDLLAGAPFSEHWMETRGSVT